MKLSIITVNLNNKKGFQKTCDSIISQCFEDFEWIVIDGGSTDGSKELIEKYQNHITYWVSEPDKGIYNAMNKGIKVAKGEYLQFLNSGDYFVSQRTLSQFFSINADKDILYGNILNPTNKKAYYNSFQKNKIYCNDLYHSTICHQASFIKKSLFEQIGYYDESLKITSDWKFLFEAILIHKCSYRYIDIDVVYYDPFGISSLNQKTILKERQELLTQYLPDYVIDDYNNNLRPNEIKKYRFSRFLFALLYRGVMLYEKFRFS